MNKQLKDQIIDNIEWFVTTEHPMTAEESSSFLMTLIDLAYTSGERDQISKELEREYQSIKANS